MQQKSVWLGGGVRLRRGECQTLIMDVISLVGSCHGQWGGGYYDDKGSGRLMLLLVMMAWFYASCWLRALGGKEIFGQEITISISIPFHSICGPFHFLLTIICFPFLTIAFRRGTSLEGDCLLCIDHRKNFFDFFGLLGIGFLWPPTSTGKKKEWIFSL